MALHGSIEINNFPIGIWSAVRKNGDETPDSINTYDVTAVYMDLESHIHTHRFELEHRYGDGAVALAAAVLSTFNILIHLKPPGD